MTYDWVPLSRIGPFVFGTPVKQYVDEYDLLFLPEEGDPAVGSCHDKIIMSKSPTIPAISHTVFCTAFFALSQ